MRGATTSSIQIEGVACSYFYRYKEDVQIMKQMGIQAYRFSIDWSRVIPDGVGKVNEKGLD